MMTHRRNFSSVRLSMMIYMVLIAGCSSTDYRYQPVEHQVSQFGRGKNEALYNEPATAPQGKVRILSMGVVDMKSKQTSKTFSALHLRIAITNQSSSEPWTLNQLDQFVSFPNEGQTKPLSLDPNRSTLVTVAPGELKTFDEYFPLPNEKMSAENLPEFDFHWQLEAGSNHVEETTSFDRIQVEERYASAYYGYYGPWLYPSVYPGWHGGGYIMVRPH